MKFQFWQEGFVFIGIFFLIVAVPCLLTAVLGTKLIDQLGQFPTKSAKLQMSICVQLLLVQVFSFIVLAMFFHVFLD